MRSFLCAATATTTAAAATAASAAAAAAAAGLDARVVLGDRAARSAPHLFRTPNGCAALACRFGLHPHYLIGAVAALRRLWPWKQNECQRARQRPNASDRPSRQSVLSSNPRLLATSHAVATHRPPQRRPVTARATCSGHAARRSQHDSTGGCDIGCWGLSSGACGVTGLGIDCWLDIQLQGPGADHGNHRANRSRPGQSVDAITCHHIQLWPRRPLLSAYVLVCVRALGSATAGHCCAIISVVIPTRVLATVPTLLYGPHCVSAIDVRTPNGQLVRVMIPQGVFPGQQFHFRTL